MRSPCAARTTPAPLDRATTCAPIEGDRAAGMTLVEVVFSITIFTLLLLTVGLSVQSIAHSARDLEEWSLAHARALEYVDMAVSLPFGTSNDPAPTALQITELFDGDADMPTGLTLWQLTGGPGAEGEWEFRLADPVVGGTFRFWVDQDLDGDGAEEAGTPESYDASTDAGQLKQLEATDEVLRIRVSYDNQPLFETICAIRAST